MHFDPTLFPEPQRFNPDRFLGTRTVDLTAGQCINVANPLERDHWSFGAGRRVCPGYTLAENSLFILTARLLWAFDINAPIDPNTGERNKPDVWNYPPRQLYGPTKFDAEFKARDIEKERMIREGIGEKPELLFQDKV